MGDDQSNYLLYHAFLKFLDCHKNNVFMNFIYWEESRKKIKTKKIE